MKVGRGGKRERERVCDVLRWEPEYSCKSVRESRSSSDGECVHLCTMWTLVIHNVNVIIHLSLFRPA